MVLGICIIAVSCTWVIFGVLFLLFSARRFFRRNFPRPPSLWLVVCPQPPLSISGLNAAVKDRDRLFIDLCYMSFLCLYVGSCLRFG